MMSDACHSMNIEPATATTMAVSTRNVKLMVAAPLLVEAAVHTLLSVSCSSRVQPGQTSHHTYLDLMSYLLQLKSL